MEAIVLLVSLLATAQASQDEIRKVFDEFFIEAGTDRCQAYAERLARVVTTAPSEGWRRRLINELPGAAQYHSTVVEFYRTRLRTFQMPTELLLEGYDLQIDQLEARVGRAARNERTPEVRAQTEAQIRLLFDSARVELKSRLTGEVASAYVDRQLNQIRDLWLGALDKVYNTLMDRPLSAEDYESVLAELRAGVATFGPVTLTAEDLLNPDRLKELGVSALLEGAQGALMHAPKLCFSDYDPGLVSRQKKWVEEVDAWQAAAVKERNEAARAARPVPSPPPPSAAPSVRSPAPEPPAKVAHPKPRVAPGSPSARSPLQPEERNRWIPVLIVAIGAVLVLGLTVLWCRSRAL